MLTRSIVLPFVALAVASIAETMRSAAISRSSDVQSRLAVNRARSTVSSLVKSRSSVSIARRTAFTPP